MTNPRILTVDQDPARHNYFVTGKDRNKRVEIYVMKRYPTCPACNTRIQDDDRFCAECGAPTA